VRTKGYNIGFAGYLGALPLSSSQARQFFLNTVIPELE
jgi:hypothetical protein